MSIERNDEDLAVFKENGGINLLSALATLPAELYRVGNWLYICTYIRRSCHTFPTSQPNYINLTKPWFIDFTEHFYRAMLYIARTMQEDSPESLQISFH